MKSLVTEICWHSTERRINVWNLMINFKEGGGCYEVDPKTKDYIPKSENYFERLMINYWGMGEDARVGVGFEKNRTATRCCNKVVYCWIGFVNMVCRCRRPPSVFSRIEYLKTKKH
jgi:diacylglycerol kinase (ATP)